MAVAAAAVTLVEAWAALISAAWVPLALVEV
jgi:hypothetical protein